MESAHGVQVVSVDDDHTLHLNEGELAKILMRESIKDLPVALVSVAGAYRGGKSFLLNFFIRYLSASPSARSDGSWLGDKSTNLTGFTWQGGSVRITTGILMWSEPFVITVPSGERVAVLLMDTQGTFDSTSSVKDCSSIFALSSLLSSTQIYNLKNNITEEDLQNLQLFTEYGGLVKDGTGKTFQILEFLVRDWVNPWEFAYGLAGGEAFLVNKFKENSNQPKELRELRQHILANFEKVTCFLMPHPGLGVANPNFKGKTSEISQEFTNELKELATSIFSPEKLCMKKVNALPVKSCDLFNYFKSYIPLFNSNKTPTPLSNFQATANSGFLVAANEVREQYQTEMHRACGSEAPSMPASEVIDLHQRELAKARAAFNDKKLMGNEEDIDKKLEKLMQELAQKLNEFIEINRLKTLKAIANGYEAYEKAIEAVTKDRPLCVHPRDLQKIHDDATAAALKVFCENRKLTKDGLDLDKDKFSENLFDKYEELVQKNEHNNLTMVAELKDEYLEYIMSQVQSLPNLCANRFEDKHAIGLSRAIAGFEERRILPNSYATDEFKSNMMQAIELQHTQAKQISSSREQDAFKSALNHFNNNSVHYRDLQNLCEHPDILRQDHEEAVKQAFLFITPLQVCDQNKRILKQEMDRHYEEIRSVNESSNERAVSRAYYTYRNKYYQLSNHWYWAFESWSKARKYHEEALDVAKEAFFRSRRSRRTYTYDYYLNNLVEKCERYYRES